MRADFDYHLVPSGFAHCLNNQCPHAANCLRQQLALHIPFQEKFIRIVNPAQAASAGEDCPYFKPDQLIRLASGITHLLDNLPHQSAVVIKQQLLSYFGRSYYYRLWRKERLLTLEDQEYIRRLFLIEGITDAPAFDEYVESYSW